MTYRTHKIHLVRRIRNVFLALVLLSTISRPAVASLCGMESLPKSVQSALRTSYANWQVVTTDMLSAEDRKIWTKEYAAGCPGIAKGDYTGTLGEYALNLLKTVDGQHYQQVLVVSIEDKSLRWFTVLAPMRVGTVSVITRVPPGNYQDAERVKSAASKHDSVALITFEAGTVQYYWSGSRFRSITTSE